MGGAPAHHFSSRSFFRFCSVFFSEKKSSAAEDKEQAVLMWATEAADLNIFTLGFFFFFLVTCGCMCFILEVG